MKFVFDLDGTICFKGKPLSNGIVQCLKDLNKEDVMFASARPIRDMLPVLPKDFHSYTLIGGNGSLIYKNGKLLYARTFTKDQLQTVLQLIEEQEATFLIDGDWNYAYTGPIDHPIVNNIDQGKLAQQVSVEQLSSVVKVLIVTMNDYVTFVDQLQQLDITVHEHCNERLIDLSPNHIHKWNALQTLGITENSYIAFGNDANDISMFQYAAYAVMIDYHDRLAPFADEQIAYQTNGEQAIVDKIRALAQTGMLKTN
ncbi:Cof-type HAD-IIB family hydrolase [Virgibacillus pantothenticus]|uniref:HAD family hydrolase n=1 Tax=Virgibacillus pantothenticus TaxID=1473 RepID=A0A0L0QUG9_VIRPA|nr:MULTISPECIES: HAD family hydrolase [Virgibacillus]API91196.1 HAD family hydrolase [Virgibacillus sp. 6R]KNE21853.1 HAD family hydrolase [Virgibacillus pantothenticus]MBS7429190.1 HAD family phosphatase [Virgibacillus sp. 19R1-5]MBU8567982.1 Cof-type HAD-IIB family hydrolase [Virgibacillus pantothenticus]MBU8601761.1 Cof-type HAD-IIB family hydrolase [Virgibacillus pantothenticus]